MPHGARLRGRGLFLGPVAAALALVGTSALPTSADTASAATASSTGSFAAITCPTTTTCFAAGSYGDHNTYVTHARAHAERWNGAKWSPASPGGTTPPLAAIECRRPHDCMAVGGSTTPVIAHWNGSTWSAAPVPVAFGPG